MAEETQPPMCPTDLVTKGDLYELDLRLGQRFTTLQDSINGVHDRINGVAERITTHEAMHVQEGREVVIDKEIKFDAKKAGIFAAISAAGAVVVEALRRLNL